MMAPDLQKLARQQSGKALVLKVNTERYPDLAARFAIQAIPTLLVFRDGKAVQRHVGVASIVAMERWLET